ncbi:MAG: BlaI/MecI/CopY family transcriptional regulator [Clostridia bacterium]|nr:BlaI/MecI/CopY family transcriptional regulator [Clostridia bacterium]
MSQVMITESEWKIMKLLWVKSPSTLTELTKSLEPETGWTRATVFVMLKRLISKNAVKMVQDSGTNVYCPAVRREDIAPAETESFINRVYDGSVGMMFSALTSRKALSEEEIAELKKILDEAEKSERSK